ncbi:S-norcoclaurine synthase 1-like [Cornus florida]|uniref:S-norcoclaurine synthase 1-like n=1 Tax=Cornus florida TaxID=4283 RepID=UPI0028996A2C|nr:S-norcoclaurine synthase 1-like [Cornus florida]
METEVGIRDFGGSLPVDNVQTLASKKPKDIPNRYIRPEVELDIISVDESLRIPVIDMSKLPGDTDELSKLHHACKDSGFFQLINHGVSEAIEKMKVVTEEFFKLPLEEKVAYAQPPNSIEGYGQAFVVSEDQKLDWGDMLFLLPLPITQRNMSLWPKTPTSFRSTLEKYSSELHKVSISLFMLMAKNLGIDPEKLTSMFEDCTQGIRMNYYPPCVLADNVMGLTPHSDATGLTLLVQVNDVQGLQIKKNCKWVPVKPIPGAIIINIGDVMEIMSNGEYSSIEHRAVVNSEKERLSIAAFHSPNLRAVVGPLPDLMKENGANYKTLSSEDYMRLVISTKLDGKSLVDHMKIKYA